MRVAYLLAALAALHAAPSMGQVRTSRTAEGSSTAAITEAARTQADATDRALREMWGLSAEEMQRAKVLALGPRASFSVDKLSPLEVLGIHARTDAERRQYAERLARLFREDVERSIAWDREMQAAMARLYPNEPMVSYEGLPRVRSSVGAADMANVPRGQIVEQAAPAPRHPLGR
ncbi:integrating conjugative element protein [Xylophilus sp. ASV27]|uniref:integrating conjugative element protein n=1 Tax=Xylophilus sp. ASV27 TaxID=2795129 RepID=UPI0018EDB33C|nr:integrating conjugative element protein [Xylophilus sp. ASV27]